MPGHIPIRKADAWLRATRSVWLASDADELDSVDELFRQKYVDPHSGASATYPQSPTDVPHRIDIERLVVWEYGIVPTRSDFVCERGEWVTVRPARGGSVRR